MKNSQTNFIEEYKHSSTFQQKMKEQLDATFQDIPESVQKHMSLTRETASRILEKSLISEKFKNSVVEIFKNFVHKSQELRDSKGKESFDEAKDIEVDAVVKEIKSLKDTYMKEYPDDTHMLELAKETIERLTEFKLMNYQDEVDLSNENATIH